MGVGARQEDGVARVDDGLPTMSFAVPRIGLASVVDADVFFEVGADGRAVSDIEQCSIPITRDAQKTPWTG